MAEPVELSLGGEMGITLSVDARNDERVFVRRALDSVQ